MFPPRSARFALFCFILNAVALLAAPVRAAPAGTLVTAAGNTISEPQLRKRLYLLLRELGEPRWSRRALRRLSRSVFAYLSVFTGKKYHKTLAALQRGNRYRPMIRTQLARAGLPLALEALPMAESAYRFDARSRMGARGLWQYMPASARRYGLKVGKGLDQRTDPVRATEAAVRYLAYLTKKFGHRSVLLAIAAYNAGEGRIARIIRKIGSRGGYAAAARFLPRETRRYVPEFLAAALILKDPGHFGFPVTAAPRYRYLQIPEPLPLQTIARWGGLSSARLKRLNPELKPYRRLPTSNYLLRLPEPAARRVARHVGGKRSWPPLRQTVAFRGGNDASAAAAPPGRLLYRVQKGNHLSGIARMFGVDIRRLRKINRLRGNRIRVGQLLVIPTRKRFVQKRYRVRSGDSLGRIARRLGVPVEHLKFVNGVTDPRRLKAGQHLLYYEYS